MNDLIDDDIALLKAANEAPLSWVETVSDMESLQSQLAAAAQHLESLRADPEVILLQRDLLATAMEHSLSPLFVRARAQQSLGKLNDLVVARVRAAAMPDTEPMHVPVRVHRRRWGQRFTHIYRVESAGRRGGDDMLTILPGDLFEVVEPAETVDGRSILKVLSRHLTLDAANKQSDVDLGLPRLVRLVSSVTRPITALAGNGAEIVVGSTTELEPVEWTDRLEGEVATGQLQMVA